MNIEEMKMLKAERGYSNEMIAERSGVPLSTVQKIFSGTTSSPRYSTLQALDRFFSDWPGCVRESVTPYRAGRQGSYTIDDYETIPDDRPMELIDGVLYDMTAPSTIHQMIIPQLWSRLHSHILSRGGSCIVMTAPTDVRLDCDDRTMIQPDVFVVCDRSKFTDKRIEGAPDFIIEVLSPSTRKKDTFIKAQKYLNAGVFEYWLVDPDAEKVVVYVFGKDPENRNVIPAVYTFEDQIPVSLFAGECIIDFAEIRRYIGFLYESGEPSDDQKK